MLDWRQLTDYFNILYETYNQTKVETSQTMKTNLRNICNNLKSFFPYFSCSGVKIAMLSELFGGANARKYSSSLIPTAARYLSRAATGHVTLPDLSILIQAPSLNWSVLEDSRNREQ